SRSVEGAESKVQSPRSKVGTLTCDENGLRHEGTGTLTLDLGLWTCSLTIEAFADHLREAGWGIRFGKEVYALFEGVLNPGRAGTVTSSVNHLKAWIATP